VIALAEQPVNRAMAGAKLLNNNPGANKNHAAQLAPMGLQTDDAYHPQPHIDIGQQFVERFWNQGVSPESDENAILNFGFNIPVFSKKKQE
jgi:hypothetical protein